MEKVTKLKLAKGRAVRVGGQVLTLIQLGDGKYTTIDEFQAASVENREPNAYTMVQIYALASTNKIEEVHAAVNRVVVDKVEDIPVEKGDSEEFPKWAAIPIHEIPKIRQEKKKKSSVLDRLSKILKGGL